MANPEHLKILKQGVKAWNKWREENFYTRPDLSEASLKDADLEGTNLSKANLSRSAFVGANLSSTDLRDAELVEADLTLAVLVEADLRSASLVGAKLDDVDLRAAKLNGADLRDTNLAGRDFSDLDLSDVIFADADLSDVNFRGSNLTGAVFTGANVDRADFREADLTQADFSETDISLIVCDSEGLRAANLEGVRNLPKDLDLTDFRDTNLSGADLNNADLEGVDLSGADLSGASMHCANLRHANLGVADLSDADLGSADLHGADLSGADLTAANLSRADLTAANLSDADLSYANLIKARLSKAIITGARLYGTAKDDWVIKGIKCDHVFWDVEGKERCPTKGEFLPGEFERVYEHLPTFQYFFEKGMSPLDALIMDRVVEGIRKYRPEFDLRIDCITARGHAPSIRFTVRLEEHKEPASEEVKKVYETKLRQLESERDRYWELIKAAFDKPREVKLITAGPGAIVATDGSTVNIQQHIHNVLELQKAIAKEPAESKTFAKIAKNKALDIIGKVLEDIAKGQVKEAAKRIIELGKDLGPIIAKTAAYAFFKSMM
jgi:uncharacterized protein YjbI with pentapeptide repeats